MNAKTILVFLITTSLMATSLTLFLPTTSSEEWTPTSDSDFSEGSLFFVESSSDTLQLTNTLICNWTAEGEATDDNFGWCVASAGDVNGDGYDDTIVGSLYNDGAGSNAGEVYLYYGSSSGLSTTADWSDQGEASLDGFGHSVASAGDVNGDGYDDVIVGANGNNGGGNDAGEAYVYYGSSSGLSTTPDWSDQGEAAGDNFGVCVASAGDVNGDSYADVVVGAYLNSDGGSDAGEAYVYYGSSSGLSATPDWSDQGEAADDFFGFSARSAGDVNSDGYDDVVIGAYHNDGGGSSAGEAYVYYGSSSGLSATPGWSAQGAAADNYFGFSLCSADDVNGDGYDDVIVGAYGNDDAGLEAGKAYLYHGSSSGLSTNPDWSGQGEAADDRFGYSIAPAGDLNGDGYDDIIVGAYGNDDAGSGAGEAYVYLGSSSGTVISPSWTARGEGAGDYFGFSVAGVGDVNSDGYDSILIAAKENDETASNAGKTYYYSLDLLPQGESSWSELGEAVSDNFGVSVARAGDVNGDGYEDVIVGASGNDDAGSAAGEAYVYHGSTSGLSATVAWSDQGEAAYDVFGSSVASAGDVNGDGYDDVIVGAYGNDDAGSAAGEVYVYHGSSSGLSATPNWSDQGEAASDYFAKCVAGAGDVNGDGYDDVIVGASQNDDVGTNAGEAYVYYGSASGLSATPDWSDQGEQSYHYFGLSVAGAGDVNNDGYDDVIAGAYGNDDGGNNAGEVYVYHGSLSGLSTTPDWSDQGETSGDYFGYCVASAGDVNGDHYSDVIIGAYKNSEAGSEAGEALVYHGSSSGLSATPDWSDQGEWADDEFGYYVAGAGDVNGDNCADVIIGAYQNDSAGSNAGKAYVYYGSSSGVSSSPDWSDTGEAADDKFGKCVASAGDVNGDGFDVVIVGSIDNDDGGTNAGKAYVYSLSTNYFPLGVYDSEVLELGDTDSHPNWLSISWNPGVQPDGTRIRAQIASSNDGLPTNWRGPGGTGASFYSGTGIQSIYSGERGKYLRVRFYLECGFELGDQGKNTPTLTDFTITYGSFTKPTVELSWPNGGENLMHGESYPVTWTTTGDLADTTPVALSYSLNGGSTWTDITTATANDGLYVWTLPSNQDVERALVKVVATAPDGSTMTDTSDRPFSIDPPPVNPETGDRVISPTAGEELATGSTVVVEWQLAGEKIVSLHYSTDFGQSWQPIVSDILNLGSYHWELPDDMTSEHVTLKVQGAQENVVSNLFIVGEGGAEGDEEAQEEDSQRIPAVLGGLTALLIICFVVLALVVRKKPEQRTSSRSNSQHPNTSQEEKK